ncbi:MAG: PilZ domain-containing protein [Bdellovibrionota bacterium]
MRPKRLTLVALFLLGIGLSFPVQIMLLYGHTPLEIPAIAAKFPPLNWLVMCLSVMSAFLVYRASPWMIAAIPVLTTAVLHNNWLVAEIGSDYPPFLVGTATGVFLLMMGMLMSKEIRALIVNPHLRWWYTPRRFRTELPVRLRVLGKNPFQLTARSQREFSTATYDLSEQGVFVLPPEDMQAELANLNEGAVCSIKVSFQKFRVLECQAQVVRISQGHGGYPPGFGLRFLGMSAQKKRLLHEYLKQISHLPSETRKPDAQAAA